MPLVEGIAEWESGAALEWRERSTGRVERSNNGVPRLLVWLLSLTLQGMRG